MSSPPSPQPPYPFPAVSEVPKYDHDDPMGMVKYLRAVDILQREGLILSLLHLLRQGA